ncbi:MAG: gluconate 2-dehydrogenase subunit 3 family protein [Rhodospirillum sp.]|nr:gluconate 2-dehydrogenase subunit 3 family protein [Rhodospirillum sp.]MCF8502665.1 gluconate 2-dehydrogenase subunit 3 family protein [Rhodospirillum sp.]
MDWHGSGFAGLDVDRQDAMLNALSKDLAPLDPKPREFWTLLLRNTKEGYFRDPRYGGNADLEFRIYIGFPGARANYYDWVGRAEAYPLSPVDIAGERA